MFQCINKEAGYYKIIQEILMNKEHEEELKELAKKGLIKMSLRGIGQYETTVVVHKNIPNKIARDFIEKEQDIVVFIDRNEDKPAKCHLYKLSCPMPSIYLEADQLEEELKEEEKDLQDCTVLILKKET